eukprot:c3873_g1_i1.p1 GENE.c3873_g1_i1~~c3873_g1_i1.p1  ORF type:complete len:231 (+),score=57.17 c3873_g1_i1:33-695(+)
MATAGPACVRIPDEYTELDTNMFCIPTRYVGDVKSVMLTAGYIHDRVKRIAADIFDVYRGQDLNMLCVLKGAFVFYNELLQELNLRNAAAAPGETITLFTNFIRVQSYENEHSTGAVKVSGMDLAELAGRNVLVVEDIVDTGTTMVQLLALLAGVGPKRVQVVSLLVKRTPRSNGYVPDFAGFSIPDVFIVGYGLDFNEHFRDLQHICVISKAGFDKYRV